MSDVCNYIYVPLNHLGNIIIRIGTTTVSLISSLTGNIRNSIGKERLAEPI